LKDGQDGFSWLILTKDLNNDNQKLLLVNILT